MFKYLLSICCVVQLSQGCDSSLFAIITDFNKETDRFEFELPRKPVIEIDRIKLNMVAPELLNYLWHVDSVESLPTWCILESLQEKFNCRSAESYTQEENTKRALISDPSTLIQALIQTRYLAVDAVEPHLIARLAAALSSSQEKKKFLITPAAFRKEYEPWLASLSSCQYRQLKAALLAPCAHWVAPTERAFFESPQRNIQSFMFSPKSSLLFSISDDLQALCLWDMRRKSLLRTFKDRPSIGTAIAFSDDDAYVALSRGNRILFLRTADTSIHMQEIAPDEEPLISTISFFPQSHTLLCNNTYYLDAPSGAAEGPVLSIKNEALSPAAPIDDEIYVRQKNIRSLAHVFPEIYSSQPAFHANGMDYAIGLRSGYVEIVARDNKETVFIDDSPIITVGLSDADNYVAGASQNGIIRVYQYGLSSLMSVYRTLMVRYIPAYVRDMKQEFPLIRGGDDPSHYQWVRSLPNGLKERLLPLLKIVE